MNISDRLPKLFRLAADSGLTLSACDLITASREAGVLDSPLRDAQDLTFVAVAAIDLLLAEIDWRSQHVLNGTPQVIAARRVRVAASLAGLLLPPVRTDQDGRFTLVLDEGGYLPGADDILGLLHRAHQRLRDYLAEHDRGQWVDANTVAGAVADVHDAARMLTALLECGGPESLLDHA